MELDLGDVIVHVSATAKHRPQVIWHIGRVLRTGPADRVPGPITHFRPERLDMIMDIQADKKVELVKPDLTDEVGNAVPTPDGSTFVYSVDRGDLIALTDNGDGTGSAACVGPLGNAVVHLDATVPQSDGSTKSFTGDLLLSVIPGDVARVEVKTGAVSEVTPDE